MLLLHSLEQADCIYCGSLEQDAGKAVSLYNFLDWCCWWKWKKVSLAQLIIVSVDLYITQGQILRQVVSVQFLSWHWTLYFSRNLIQALFHHSHWRLGFSGKKEMMNSVGQRRLMSSCYLVHTFLSTLAQVRCFLSLYLNALCFLS